MLKKIYNVLDKICEPIACACFAVIVIITFANVIMRYVFSMPLPWVEEVSALLYTYMVFFGLSVTHKKNSSVSVDIIVELMPAKLQKVMNIISIALTIAVWLVLIVLGCKLALTTNYSFTSYLRIPYKYLYWFFPVSGFFCVVQLLHRVAMIIRGESLEEAEPGEGQV